MFDHADSKSDECDVNIEHLNEMQNCRQFFVCTLRIYIMQLYINNYHSCS